MTHTTDSSIAFLITAPPYGSRSPRSELDFVLSALALDQRVKVFFLGASMLQLAADRSLADSGLGPGYRGWSALADFGEAELYAETKWLDYCETTNMKLIAEVLPMKSRLMSQAWRGCARALVLS